MKVYVLVHSNLPKVKLEIYSDRHEALKNCAKSIYQKCEWVICVIYGIEKEHLCEHIFNFMEMYRREQYEEACEYSQTNLFTIPCVNEYTIT